MTILPVFLVTTYRHNYIFAYKDPKKMCLSSIKACTSRRHIFRIQNIGIYRALEYRHCNTCILHAWHTSYTRMHYCQDQHNFPIQLLHHCIYYISLYHVEPKVCKKGAQHTCITVIRISCIRSFYSNYIHNIT